MVIGIGCYPKIRLGSKWVARDPPSAEKPTSDAPRSPAEPYPALPEHHPTRYFFGMLAFNDNQLQIVMTAAGSVPVEKRSTFLERVAARLPLRGSHFTDADLGAAIQAALTGLIQSAA